MDDVLIQEASVEHINMLVHIIRASHLDVARRFQLTKDNCPKHPSCCSSDWVTADLNRGVRYWLLICSEKPVGCIAVEYANPEICYIERLSVLPDHRRNGFGKLLVEHAIGAVRDVGARIISIGIIAEFAELKKWYAGMGFIERETKIIAHLPFQVLMMSYGV